MNAEKCIVNVILTYAFELILVANDYDVSLTVIQIVICCLGPLFCPNMTLSS